jgi:hypothetical protein
LRGREVERTKASSAGSKEHETEAEEAWLSESSIGISAISIGGIAAASLPSVSVSPPGIISLICAPQVQVSTRRAAEGRGGAAEGQHPHRARRVGRQPP